MIVVCDVVGCEYGDRVLGCKDFYCNMVNDFSVLIDCCNICFYGIFILIMFFFDFFVCFFIMEELIWYRLVICVDFVDING